MRGRRRRVGRTIQAAGHRVIRRGILAIGVQLSAIGEGDEEEARRAREIADRCIRSTQLLQRRLERVSG